MKRRTWISSLFVLLFGAATFQAAAQEPATNLLETINRRITALYLQTKDAIVRVYALHPPPISMLTLLPPRCIGTGFFIRADGTLVTAATVVNGAQACWVECNHHRLQVRILGVDPRCNLAVLKIDPAQCPNAPHETPFLTVAPDGETIAGSMVVAIGYPYDQPSAPSVGFIDGFDIRQGSHIFPVSHIRASCRLSPGQAGSPLLNSQGELVGVAVAAHQDDDCYALPALAARKVWTDILEKGAPQYGWVGLEVTEKHDHDVPRLVVAQVFPETPAAKAGFRPGDTLVRIQTNAVHQLSDLMDTIFYRHQGDRVDFTVLRGDQSERLTVVVGGSPPTDAAPSAPPATLTPVSTEH